MTHEAKPQGSFLWVGVNCLKGTELLGDSLLFTIMSPGLPGTHLIKPGSMKS